MLEFLGFISLLLTLYIYILFAAAIMSWLIAFNVVNPRNQFVAMLAEFLYRITEPVLRPIRSFLPNLGGIDISPVIVILIIVFIQSVILSATSPRHSFSEGRRRPAGHFRAAALDDRARRRHAHGAADAERRARCGRRHRADSPTDAVC